MSMSDPIADMLSCIRNAQAVRKESVEVSGSKIKLAISNVLLEEGYLNAVEHGNRSLILDLKYYQNKAVIDSIKRVSRPGLRVYVSKDNIPRVIGGMGIVIISTSKGVMTGQKASAAGVGGEVLCAVY